ncbi:MAG TPA: MFS transporter [Casimicrobiaceae bacterium]
MTRSAADAGGRAIRALAVTLAIQAFTSLAATATSVLAPEIAPAAGFSPRLIGVFVGLVYAGSMLGSLFSGGFIERYGAIRVSQIGALACAAGVALVCGPIWALALAPMVIGLGYGTITPASSHLLARTAPPNRMALTFSIKQTGVPLGAALAGATLPALALAFGWRSSLFLIALAGIGIVLIAQSTRKSLDIELARHRRVSLSAAFAPLKLIARDPRLTELALVGFFYAATQVCLMSYLVVYLAETLKASLVTAGFALTIANVGGIVGRIAWGAVADRRIPPRRMLALLGLTAGACSIATATFNQGWPPFALMMVCAIFGATAIGWNGVQLAEVARNAPEGQAGAVTGASGFVTFAGVVMGPPVFAVMVAFTANYRMGFLLFGCTSLICGSWLLVRSR